MMGCIVRLASTGEVVDIATPDGANAFLRQPTGTGGFNFFSADLKTVNAIRKRERKKGKLNSSDRLTLRDIYRTLLNVAGHGEPELFRKKVPKRELEAWLKHVVEIFQQITSDRKWLKTGSMLQHDSLLMSSLVGLFVHSTAVQLILGEIKVFETISEMVSSLEKPPSVDFAIHLIAVVNSAFQCCRVTHQFEDKWTTEKTLKKLEPTGILPHFLRCAAMEGQTDSVSPFFKELLTCTAYVQKRFKEGTPCGDTVRAIVKETDGHSPSTRVLPYMNSLIRLSAEALVRSKNVMDRKVVCAFCGKHDSEESFKHCAKCLEVAYCSRDCQRADWKRHKKACGHPMNSRDKKNASASQHLVRDFTHNRFVSIMLRMVEESDKACGLNFNEMVVELDITPGSNGVIPLLQDPPEFKIVPVAKYVDGTQLFQPDDRYQDNEERFLAGLKYQQSLRRPTELLCVVSHDCSYSCQSFERPDEGSKKHVFSQAGVEAFRNIVANKDVSMLWEIVTSQNEREFILNQCAMHLTQQGAPSFFFNVHHRLDPYRRCGQEAMMNAIRSAIESSDYTDLVYIFGEKGVEQMKSDLEAGLNVTFNIDD